MDFLIDKKSFGNQIQMASRGIPSRTDVPILKSLLLEVKNKHIYVVGSDQEMMVVTRLPVETSNVDRFCIEGKVIDGVFKKIKKIDEVQLKTEGTKLVVAYEGAHMALQTSSAKEYPSLPSVTTEASFEISTAQLLESVTQTAFATMENESRPVLRAILFHIEDEQLTMVSTDGYRMSLKLNKVESITGTANILVPARCLLELSRVLKLGKVSSVQARISKDWIVFEAENVSVFIHLMDGQFLNYEPIFQMPAVTKAMVEKMVFLDVLERATVLNPKDKNLLVKMSVESESVSVLISSPAGEISESIEANVTGDPIEVGLNMGYVLSALKSMSGERVRINFAEFPGNQHSITFESVGNKAFKHLILPIRKD